MRRLVPTARTRGRGWLPSVDGPFLRRLAYLGSRYGPEPLVRYSPTLVGALFALALPNRRRIVIRALRRVRGERHWMVEQLDAVRTFSHYAHCLAESLGAGRRAMKSRVNDERELQDILAAKSGLVLVTAHTGLWDVTARLLARSSEVDVKVVMQREADARARAFHDQLRTDARVEIVHVDHPVDSMDLLRHLRRGGVVAIQMDRVPHGQRGIELRLGGAPFRVPAGPFLLAAAARVPVLAVFARRVDYFDYEITFGRARRLPSRPADTVLYEAASAFVEELAAFVQEHPNDWFHFDEG